MPEIRSTTQEDEIPTMRLNDRLEAVIILDDSETTEICANIIDNCMRNMFKALKSEPLLNSDRTLLTIITFSTKPELVLNGLPITQLTDDCLPKLHHKGATDPAAAIDLAISTATDRYDEWRRKKLKRVHPIFYFCTDGKPDYGVEEGQKERDPIKQAEIEKNYEEQKKRIKELQKAKQLTFVTLGFGPDADYEDLRTITPYNNEIPNTDAEKMDYFFSKVIVSTTVQKAKNKDNDFAVDFINDLFGNSAEERRDQ